MVEGGEYDIFPPIACGCIPPLGAAGVALRVRNTVAPSASRRYGQLQCGVCGGRACFVFLCFVSVRAGISR